MTPSSKPPVLQLSQLAEAVQAGVVLALEDRKAAIVNGGGILMEPLFPVLTGAVGPMPGIQY